MVGCPVRPLLPSLELHLNCPQRIRRAAAGARSYLDGLVLIYVEEFGKLLGMLGVECGLVPPFDAVTFVSLKELARLVYLSWVPAWYIC